jgi:subtilisin family serine protease
MRLIKFSAAPFLTGWLALAALCGTAPTANAQEQTFYYKKGEKVALKVDTSKAYVLFRPEITQERVEKATKSANAVLQRFDSVKEPEGLNLTQDPPTKGANWAIIENFDVAAQPLAQPEVANNVIYRAPFLLTADNKQVGMSHLVNVKLKAPGDKAKLEGLAKDLKVTIVGNNKFMPLWYTLACTKDSAGNALQVANKLYESNIFASAEPDFLADFRIKCADDGHFGAQWGLKNTGQNGGTPGIDVGVCEAWPVATGKGVKVAVVDHGIQLDHPDLKANVYHQSFDTGTGKSPSQVRGNHGTACAGIIAAVRGNNKLGVAGVAPDATLISVSDSLTLAPNAAQNLATGIAWATQNGADVISNSWGHDKLASSLIDDAIDEALTNGRGGRGCVVVFAAGNNDGAVIYPANSNPQILVVGAMSPCGERKSTSSCDPEGFWGSCFGIEVDVVAPGVLIPTTDRTGTAGYDAGDYALTFNGTSSATPHVAGVAALILQANPNLTQRDVVMIIEKSARKVGPYSYQPTAGRPNGDWFQEMGYGLVDAKACLNAAK